MADIYQDLWDADAAEDGLTVCARPPGGPGWDDDTADVLLDIQREAAGSAGRDLATRPLFARVNDRSLERPVYSAVIALFDNYVASVQEEEVETPDERREIEGLLDVVMETRVARIGLDYVRDELGAAVSGRAFRAALDRMWFEMYTNWFGGKEVEYASGFEHVLVGEARYATRRGRRVQLGEVSGYHSWVKFYLDERSGRADFLGHRYDLYGGEVPCRPNVVTLQMLWEPSGEGASSWAFKKKGGFFVGSSPACELVMGAVAFFESQQGMLPGDRRRTVIHGAALDLVLHRSTTPRGTRGEHIRTFYPVYVGPAAGPGDEGTGDE